MDKLLTLIGEFLAVDVETVSEVKYCSGEQSALIITTESGDEILLNLVCLK